MDSKDIITSYTNKEIVQMVKGMARGKGSLVGWSILRYIDGSVYLVVDIKGKGGWISQESTLL